ncbi:aminofutalosine synthase MqnE [Propionispora vibrioides]|uniref:Aminodeoxyfutalosine synthase n=1 Tax=Propionispora vibrioides TaxID=112903 RepID=A0A1H8WPW7_9FIRM|nr:aminofutalosine synthase MqnE [Propionispora vibrioides]SEP29543.1 aminodeoxyfutalosine synthase [Propionispora vibrioides]
MNAHLHAIETKIGDGVRLSKEDGLALFACQDLSWLGYLADQVRQRISGDYVYFNVNRHINLTNICTSRCKFCAFGCDADSRQAYQMSKERVLEIARQAATDPDLKELHIVSGLHPEWPFDYYVDVIASLKQALPGIHLKAFTAVEICHFAKVSGKPVREVLQILQTAGVDSLPGGGAEILSDRVRQMLCPNKATAAEWLQASYEAHRLGLKSNASMLYGHVETLEERVDHLLALRALQDETGGFQTFICFPFHSKNTELGHLARTSQWDDLKTMAISRLLLDNFKNIKAYWIMLTLPLAQLALGFGANDMDGTVSEEKIMHAAGAKSAKSLEKTTIIETIRQVGRIPVQRDSMYNILKVL